MFAERILKVEASSGAIDVPIRIFKPERVDEVSWTCRFEIDWPTGRLNRYAVGGDAVQALQLAMQLVGTSLYTCEFHKQGKLVWLEQGRGYGFPVPRGLRDLLVGDDADDFA